MQHVFLTGFQVKTKSLKNIALRNEKLKFLKLYNTVKVLTPLTMNFHIYHIISGEDEALKKKEASNSRDKDIF